MKTNAWFVNCADFRDSDVAIEFSFQKKEQVRTCKNEKEKWVGARQSIRLVLLKEEIDGPNRRQLPEKYKWIQMVCKCMQCWHLATLLLWSVQGARMSCLQEKNKNAH